MLAFLISPLRRWLLATLLLPLIAVVLAKLGRYLERRRDGSPTKLSRVLMSGSSGARRLSGKKDDDARAPDPGT